MYELIKVSEKCYYIDSPSKIGVVDIGGGKVVLIDSGNNRDVGKKIKKILDEKGWQLSAIYNTHSHADHIGANKYLQNLTGCKIFARGIEADFTNHPILESTYIYGGRPPRDLCHKFLLAEECVCDYLTEESLVPGMHMIELLGHSFDMVGFVFDDGVAYIGDALSSIEVLNKYGIGFIYDPDLYIETLNKLLDVDAKIFIPTHAALSSDLSELVLHNVKKVSEIKEKIISLCREPKSFEEILKELFDQYSLNMNFEQYALVGSTVRSYLSRLLDNGKISVSFDANIMKFFAKED